MKQNDKIISKKNFMESISFKQTGKLYTCSICGERAKNNDTLWILKNEIWCEKCLEEAENGIEQTSKD